jgi:flavodoxin
MRKVFKIILAVFAALIILLVAFAALIFLDLAAYTATSVETLSQVGTPMGTALVLYDPGLSGASTRVAQQVAADLQNKTLTVTLAGIKSSAAANTTGYDVIVIGGPIYAGVPTASVKDTLSNLQHDTDTRVGVFGSGQGSTTPDDVAQIKSGVPALQSGGALSNAVVVKIGESEDVTARAWDFATQLAG